MFEAQSKKKQLRICAPKKTQINLYIPAVWSESSLSAWKNFVSFDIQNEPSEDSDQTAWMRSDLNPCLAHLSNLIFFI